MSEARLARLERLLSKVPVRPVVPPASAPAYYFLKCGTGNLVRTVGTTNIYGLKYPAAPVTYVPTAAPPTTDGSCPDGLTWAYVDLSDGFVWPVWMGTRIQPAGAGAIYTWGTWSIFAGGNVMSATIVSMPIGSAAGTTFASVWVPTRL